MENKNDTEKLCPTCQTGKDSYSLDSRSPVCPHIDCHNGTSCTFYVPIKNQNITTENEKK